MMKPYQFKVSKPQGAKVTPVNVPSSPTPASATVPMLPFGSRLESWCYMALLALGWKAQDIAVQVAIDGGRTMPGGQVIDIVLYKPTSCAISLKGEYFHSDDADETYKDAIAMQYFNEYVIIWWKEAPTYEAMLSVVRERVGTP